MSHFATLEFWELYHALPVEVRALADKNFALLKKVGPFWSARVGLHYRVLARERPEGLVWFWIGPHAAYDVLIR